MKRLYRIYNIDKDAWGEPFVVCDHHYEEWKRKLPNTLLVEKIADRAEGACQI